MKYDKQKVLALWASKEELKALEATDKTSVVEEDGGKKKSKLNLLRDKARHQPAGLRNSA